jgi:hypothetical protein
MSLQETDDRDTASSYLSLQRVEAALRVLRQTIRQLDQNLL